MNRAAVTLVADIGGTNVRFALSQPGAKEVLIPGSAAQFQVADFESPLEAIRLYLRQSGSRPAQAVLAFAGPIGGDVVAATNNSWSASGLQIRTELGMESVRLVNDFAAMSAALAVVPSRAMQVLGLEDTTHFRLPQSGVIAVIGPGTGLGVGVLVMRGGQSFVVETEGGHCAFAPLTDEQVEIFRALTTQFGRVSNERLLSGAGLINIYRAVCSSLGVASVACTPEAVSASAADGSDPQAVRAVELFCEILGAVAGDVAMTCGAWDGVCLAGGLIEPMLPWLRSGAFRQRFESKGRIAPAMARVRTFVLTYEHAGLVGAGALASGQAVLMRWLSPAGL